MADTIAVRGVRAFGRHGVLEHEREQGQDFDVDVVMEVDTTVAVSSDDVLDTVNYAEVAATVVLLVGGPAHQLIETLAARIADAVLVEHVGVQALEVTVHKPQAPVGVPFSDVSVTVRRRRQVPVVVALGANQGHAASTVGAAVGELGDLPEVWGVRASDLYLTDPVGGPAQNAFVNAVALAQTSLSPAALLRRLHLIEDRYGRVREVRWGPRTLDLDLIQYGDPRAGTEVRLEHEGLQLPHPRAIERAFVLVPWHDVDPSASVWTGHEVAWLADLLAGVDTSGVRPEAAGR
ncbi:MAG: 2-amino-4-hydroxy-6-hydroxymethyldihydropteridine diphosphokinase [Ornithinimicrobium sp.]